MVRVRVIVRVRVGVGVRVRVRPPWAGARCAHTAPRRRHGSAELPESSPLCPSRLGYPRRHPAGSSLVRGRVGVGVRGRARARFGVRARARAGVRVRVRVRARVPGLDVTRLQQYAAVGTLGGGEDGGGGLHG